MTDTLWGMGLAALAFFGLHLLPVVPGLRANLIQALGRNPYRGLFSLLSIAAIVWLCWANNRAPYVELWQLGSWARLVPLAAMPLALSLLALVYAAPDQAKIIMRHPMLGAVALWGLTHLLPNGDAASLILFGGFALFSIVDMPLNDARVRREEPTLWSERARTTSLVPFAAYLAGRTPRFEPRRLLMRGVAPGVIAFLVILFVHGYVFDQSALP